MFVISGLIYLIGAIIYGIFASGEKQPWADDTKKEKLSAYENTAMEIETF